MSEIPTYPSTRIGVVFCTLVSETVIWDMLTNAFTPAFPLHGRHDHGRLEVPGGLWVGQFQVTNRDTLDTNRRVSFEPESVAKA